MTLLIFQNCSCYKLTYYDHQDEIFNNFSAKFIIYLEIKLSCLLPINPNRKYSLFYEIICLCDCCLGKKHKTQPKNHSLVIPGAKMADMAISRIKREFKEVVNSREVGLMSFTSPLLSLSLLLLSLPLV